MGIETEETIETTEEQYGGADGPAAAEQPSAMEQDTAAISPRKRKRTWEETLELLETTHTISIGEICRELKCSRSWVNKYIIPYIDKVYLDNGFRGDRMSKKSWTLVAAIRLQDERYLSDSIWCNRKEYEELIRANTISVKKQTKRIPIELLVKDKKAFAVAYNQAYAKTKKSEQMLIECNDPKKVLKEVREQKRRMNDIINEHLSAEGKHIMDADIIDITHRSKTIPVTAPLPETPIEKWEALHDQKGYGGTDEHVLRRFYKHGYVRVEVHIPDPKELDDPAAILRQMIRDSYTDSDIAAISASTSVNCAHRAAGNEDVSAKQQILDTAAKMESDSESYKAAIWDTVKCSKKIYYIPDPDPILHRYVDKYITISENMWHRYENKLLRYEE